MSSTKRIADPVDRLESLERRFTQLEGTIESLAQRLGTRPSPRRGGTDATHTNGTSEVGQCALPDVPERQFGAAISVDRRELIREHAKKWVNGTRLHYYFFEPASAGGWVPTGWVGGESQYEVVRESFAQWKDVSIGLEFEEVDTPQAAEIKISFARADGSWSYIGRDAIDYAGGPSERTMNFGWDLRTAYGRDTALHEIGHALGFPHEHQNPLSGIVWDEEAVYRYFGGPPNNWDRAKTKRNVLDKIPTSEVEGSNWDPDSIMHYQFAAGLILQPERYRTSALLPAGGLSGIDLQEARRFYPPIAQGMPVLEPLKARQLEIAAGQQADFAVRPTETRIHRFSTFGTSDTVMVLFEEEEDGTPAYRIGDDDSGTDLNASFEFKLVAGRRYVLRIRLFWAGAYGKVGVMCW